jgi:preprotein translocase subunit SecB
MSESQDSGDKVVATSGETTQVQFRIERLFLKDSSFESPNSPEVFKTQWRPEIKVDINTRANPLGDDLQEVVLTATVTATLEEEMVAFIVEVQQGGIFLIQGADAPQLSQIIGIACPNTLFPYLRETIDNWVVKGGFPALQLAQVNFESLYVQAMQEREQREQASQAGGEDQQDGTEITTHCGRFASTDAAATGWTGLQTYLEPLSLKITVDCNWFKVVRRNLVGANLRTK